MSTKSPKEGGEDFSRDDDDAKNFEWKQIETAFKNDAFILLNELNGAIREELLSIYRSSAYAAQKEHSKFVIAGKRSRRKKATITMRVLNPTRQKAYRRTSKAFESTFETRT